VERFLGLWELTSLLDLSPDVSKTTGTLSASRPSHGIVAGVLVDNESPLGVTENLLRSAAAASGRIAIDDELGGDCYRTS